MKTNRRERCRSILEKAGMHRTIPRQEIIEVLLQSKSPVTQEQVGEKIRGKAPDKVTIYRTLESLVKSGLVHKAFLHNRTWHYELADNCSEFQCHPHFTCKKCGDTHCMTGVSVPMAGKPAKGYIIHRQRVQIEGICPKCNV